MLWPLIGAEEQEFDAEPFTEKYPRLLPENWKRVSSEGERLMPVVREQLKRVSDAA